MMTMTATDVQHTGGNATTAHTHTHTHTPGP